MRETKTNGDDVAVAVENLSKTYPIPFARLRRVVLRKDEQPTEALRGVSFQIKRGEIFGLIGRNGAGKTTLTKIIATLVQPTEGSVKVFGDDSVRDEERVRASIGLATAEERSFYWRLTSEQNLQFFARLYGLPDRTARQRINELIEQFDLATYRKKRFGELSTGNKQRLAVARAMLHEPPVLLLDEPTRSLDPVAAARTRALIGALAQSSTPTTILLTSHNLAEIEELCARVAVISQGQIKAIDAPANLRRLHHAQQRVRLTVRFTSDAAPEDVLRRAGLNVEASDAIPHQSGDNPAVVLTLLRDGNDDKLDRALHALHEAGATIINCETEQASLLDVLESYESTPS